MTETSTDEQLNAIARATIGSHSGVFKLSNCSENRLLRIKVEVASPLFKRENFPFEVSVDENVNAVVRKVLPGFEAE